MKIVTAFITFLFAIQGCVGFRVVCVYTNWSQYRPDGGKFLPEDVDPTLCTHLIYVYAKLKGNKLAAVEWNDEGTRWNEGMYQRVNNLKDINPDLKTLLGVGGWMMGSKDFSRLAAGRTSRKIFARTTVKFLRDRHFDGLTIDWQHPTKRGGRAKDKENYSLLLKELRRAFNDEGKKTKRPPLLLTAGVSASRDIIDNAYEVGNLTKYTDFLNVMAYDLHGDWDNYTGHPSQLYSREDEFGPSSDVNVDGAMQHWMSLIPDKSKLILGVSTYGRTFTLRKARHHEYNVPTTGPGLAGEFTQQPGMLAYYERCLQYADAPRVWDPVSQVAYWYSGDQWIAGEDIDSIFAKVNWTRTNQIGGMMLWSLDTDDFKDTCFNGAFTLLNTVVTELEKPLDTPPPIIVNTINDFTTSTSMFDITTTMMPTRKPRRRRPPAAVVNKRRQQIVKPRSTIKRKQTVVKPQIPASDRNIRKPAQGRRQPPTRKPHQGRRKLTLAERKKFIQAQQRKRRLQQQKNKKAKQSQSAQSGSNTKGNAVKSNNNGRGMPSKRVQGKNKQALVKVKQPNKKPVSKQNAKATSKPKQSAALLVKPKVKAVTEKAANDARNIKNDNVIKDEQLLSGPDVVTEASVSKPDVNPSRNTKPVPSENEAAKVTSKSPQIAKTKPTQKTAVINIPDAWKVEKKTVDKKPNGNSSNLKKAQTKVNKASKGNANKQKLAKGTGKAVNNPNKRRKVRKRVRLTPAQMKRRRRLLKKKQMQNKKNTEQLENAKKV